MKTSVWYCCIFMSVLLALSCNNEQSAIDPFSVEINASNFEVEFLWKEGNHVYVYNDTQAHEFYLVDGSDSSCGVFSSTSLILENQTEYFGIYAPARFKSFMYKEGISLEIPQEQTYLGSRDDYLNLNSVFKTQGFYFDDNKATVGAPEMLSSGITIPVKLDTDDEGYGLGTRKITKIDFTSSIEGFFVGRALLDGRSGIQCTPMARDTVTVFFSGEEISNTDVLEINLLMWIMPDVALAGETFDIVLYDNAGRKSTVSTTAMELAPGKWTRLPELTTGEWERVVEGEDIGEGLANCYIVAPNAILEFDTAIANADGTVRVQFADDVEARLLWTDNPGGLKSVPGAENASINNLAVVRRGADLMIIVESGTRPGNAVVALFNNTTSKIVWSWHIWVTDYAPDDADVGASDGRYDTPDGGFIAKYTSEGTGAATNVFMDRNLGALSNSAGDLSSKGLCYQWGRKDPFPTHWQNWTYDTEEPTLYDASGTPSTSLISMTVVTSLTGDNNLEYSINNPATYLTVVGTGAADNYGDWYSATAGNQNNSLWGAGSTKSPYDPCPAGWRLPSNNNNNTGLGGAWAGIQAHATTTEGKFPATDNGRQHIILGYYPFTSGRTQSGIFNTAVVGNYWYDNVPPRNTYHGGFMQVKDGTGTANYAFSNSNAGRMRAVAYAVRCVKEI
jgi:hypothetical protein